MSKKAKKLRKEILEKVKELHREEQKEESFELGKDIILFAARVSGEKEKISLVDSSLDFWLTTVDMLKNLKRNLRISWIKNTIL